MKVDEFLHPGQVEECIKEAEVEHVTSLTPSGLEVFYSWAPRRHYKLQHQTRQLMNTLTMKPFDAPADWREVPSVTTVLNVLDKSGALTWWGMKVGVEGVMELFAREVLGGRTNAPILVYDPEGAYEASVDDIVGFLTQEKLTVNHQKDSAAKRGVNVHSAFEKWAEDQSFRPVVDTYPETEQGYIKGLISFLDDLGEVEDVESEVMVGSIQHGFAGRYDLRFASTPAFDEKTVVTKAYPKRDAKRSVLPTGRFLVDLKTSKGIYPTHALQLAAYEMASVECGYGPTDHRAVVHVTADGKYELVLTHASPDDFLSVLGAHQTMQNAKGWT